MKLPMISTSNIMWNSVGSFPTLQIENLEYSKASPVCGIFQPLNFILFLQVIYRIWCLLNYLGIKALQQNVMYMINKPRVAPYKWNKGFWDFSDIRKYFTSLVLMLSYVVENYPKFLRPHPIGCFSDMTMRINPKQRTKEVYKASLLGCKLQPSSSHPHANQILLSTLAVTKGYMTWMPENDLSSRVLPYIWSTNSIGWEEV
jgi:hypothetical protein